MNTALERFRRSYRMLLLGGVSVLLFLLAAFAFLRAGSWLVREDALAGAPVVVVLSGGLPERALAAADVFKSAGAREVWLTRPLEPGAAMQRLRLPYSGEEQYSRMVLIDRRVGASRYLHRRGAASRLRRIAETAGCGADCGYLQSAYAAGPHPVERRIRGSGAKAPTGSCRTRGPLRRRALVAFEQ